MPLCVVAEHAGQCIVLLVVVVVSEEGEEMEEKDDDERDVGNCPRAKSSSLEYESVTDWLQRRIRDNGDKSLESLSSCGVLSLRDTS